MPDGLPIWNYVKVYLSIWVQMVIVISIGVAISALVSGPVAMLFTVAFIVLGFFKPFFVGVAMGTEYGGGPVESLYRIVTQKNVISCCAASCSRLRRYCRIFPRSQPSISQPMVTTFRRDVFCRI